MDVLLRVRLRFWSRAKLLSLGDTPVRSFKELGCWVEPGSTSWFKFSSKKWSVASGRTVGATQ